MRRLRYAFAVLCVLATAGPAPVATAQPLPVPAHIVIVVEENKPDSAIMGSKSAPYLNTLANSGANMTQSFAEAHPSEPNYLALFSGNTFGLTSDACPVNAGATPNLASELLAAGYTFGGFSEDLPSVGATDCSAGKYARKHVPWADFPALPTSVNQPYSALPTDLTKLPTVSFVVPNLCDDMHDCGVAAGDSWVKAHLPAYVDWARTHNSLLVVTFDEDEGTAGNHIATLLIGPMVTPGPSSQRIDHYSVLRTLEEMYGLAPIGAAATAQPITGVWSG